MKAWFQALRAHFLTATVAPVLVGTAAAWYTAGAFNLANFLLALVGGVLIHLGANMSNDYFDFLSETDIRNQSTNVYSGGSRVIQAGLIPARQVLAAAIATFVAGSLIGVWLVIRVQSIPLLVIGVVGVFCAYFYTGAPLHLGYRGFAELLNCVSFGPIIGLGAYAVQAPLWNTTALLAAVPPGVLLAVLLMINEFPDYESDRAVNKRTFVVRLGKKRALTVYHLSMLVPFVWVTALVIAGVFPAWTLGSLLTFPLAVQAWRISSRSYGDGSARDRAGQDHSERGILDRPEVGANMATFLLHLSFSVLLALGLFLG